MRNFVLRLHKSVEDTLVKLKRPSSRKGPKIAIDFSIEFGLF